MKSFRSSALPALAYALTFHACQLAPDAVDPVIDAWPVLATDAPHWAWVLRGVAVVAGTLRLREETLRDVETWSNTNSSHGTFVTFQLDQGECLLGGAKIRPSYDLWVHRDTRVEDAAVLRAVRGQSCWFVLKDDGGLCGLGANALHPTATTQQQLAAVRTLLGAPPAELARPVARPSSLVEQIVVDLRAHRIDSHQAMARLEPWTEALLPGLLHAMLESLAHHHDGDGLVAQWHAQVGGYHTEVRCVFDVLCFASMPFRDFLDQAPQSDEARTAEARALAVWLRFRALGMPPLPADRASAR